MSSFCPPEPPLRRRLTEAEYGVFNLLTQLERVFKGDYFPGREAEANVVLKRLIDALYPHMDNERASPEWNSLTTPKVCTLEGTQRCREAICHHLPFDMRHLSPFGEYVHERIFRLLGSTERANTVLVWLRYYHRYAAADIWGPQRQNYLALYTTLVADYLNHVNETKESPSRYLDHLCDAILENIQTVRSSLGGAGEVYDQQTEGILRAHGDVRKITAGSRYYLDRYLDDEEPLD